MKNSLRNEDTSWQGRKIQFVNQCMKSNIQIIDSLRKDSWENREEKIWGKILELKDNKSSNSKDPCVCPVRWMKEAHPKSYHCDTCSGKEQSLLKRKKVTYKLWSSGNTGIFKNKTGC